MSALLIDAGNTNLKWAFFENGQMSPVKKIALNRVDPEALIAQCFSNQPASRQVLISNVAGVQVGDALQNFFEKQWNLSPVFAASQRNFNGLVNAYINPVQLGVDRWLAMIYVNEHFAKPFCVVDSGTAVTIDAVDRYGKHLGGLILPGLYLMKSAMNEYTNAIKIVDLNEQSELFANNTQAAVTAGVTYSITALIEKVYSSLQKNAEEKVNCIISGGDAARIQQQLETNSVLKSDLVLKGLAIYSGLLE